MDDGPSAAVPALGLLEVPAIAQVQAQRGRIDLGLQLPPVDGAEIITDPVWSEEWWPRSYARIVTEPLFCWTGRCRVVLSNARVLMRGRDYRSVKATSNELNTGLNIYRMIDFEPVWIWACNTIPGAIG